jgi:hypothetical protein
MDDARQKFIAAFMGCPVYWEAVTHIDDHMDRGRNWQKARKIYYAYMEAYVANVPMEITPNPDSIHMRMVSAHAVALASILAKFS